MGGRAAARALTMRAPEPSLAPTRAAPLPPDLAAPPAAYPPPAAPRRGLGWPVIVGLGCLLVLLLGLCLVVGFFLTPFGQDLLLQWFG